MQAARNGIRNVVIDPGSGTHNRGNGWDTTAGKRGERHLQTGQGAAETRISALWQDLTPRNADLEPILDRGSMPFALKPIYAGFRLPSTRGPGSEREKRFVTVDGAGDRMTVAAARHSREWALARGNLRISRKIVVVQILSVREFTNLRLYGVSRWR